MDFFDDKIKAVLCILIVDDLITFFATSPPKLLNNLLSCYFQKNIMQSRTKKYLCYFKTF